MHLQSRELGDGIHCPLGRFLPDQAADRSRPPFKTAGFFSLRAGRQSGVHGKIVGHRAAMPRINCCLVVFFSLHSEGLHQESG
jgi:hypothetical protein